MNDFDVETKSWWKFLGNDLRELIKESVFLSSAALGSKEKFEDYAFVVFPAAKAYEGFLKTLFYKAGFISEEEYKGKHFRIGKALNPNLAEQLGDNSLYERLRVFSGNRSLADSLWSTWIDCRNLLFHWFPEEKNAIDFPESKARLTKIFAAMELAYNECKIKL